jgi:GNAT superfamily N-acetyltransferase/RimJ/RimL family protein N-acetyltransferase
VPIKRFDPESDETSLRRCYEIMTAAGRLDSPELPGRTFAGFTNWWAHGHDANPRQTWLATSDAGEPVGCYLLTLPERENTDLAKCVLAVLPARRRAGSGTALLAHCAGQARLAGRARLSGEARDGSPAAAFAAAAGATSGIADLTYLLMVDEVLASRVATLRPAARQRSDGYHLDTWLGVTPPEYLDDLAAVSAAYADAPRDEGMEPEIFGAEQIARMEQLSVRAGWRLYSAGARHDQTGELAAITQAGTDPQIPGWGFQSLTAVRPGHRGHRLGLLVKLAMLDLLAEHEPALQRIMTGNSDGNEHMLAINAALGFELSSVQRAWELALR